MTAEIISTAVVLGIVCWLYLAVSYLKNKGGSGCDGGCSGCAARGACGRHQKEQTKPDQK